MWGKRLTEDQLKAITARSSVRTHRFNDEDPDAEKAPDKPPKRAKYGNVKVKTEEGTFDSKREYERWLDLKQMQAQGLISGLERQVKFVLAPAVKIKGRQRPAIRYFADFRYQANGRVTVEDVKGLQTKVYRIKRHLMLAIHGIEIHEV